jgi:hypothetical protein
MPNLELLRVFEAYSQKAVLMHPEMRASLDRNKSKNRITLFIPKKNEDGFDIKAVCQEWGIYPEAGPYDGGAWEPMGGWSSEDVCRELFGLFRMLLSKDGRLRITYRQNKIININVELHRIEGWSLEDPLIKSVIPSEEITIKVLQNDHLPARYPYEGLTPTEEGYYIWS